MRRGDAVGKAQMDVGDVGDAGGQDARRLARHIGRGLAQDGQDDGDVVRREGPDHVLFGADFSKAEAARIDVLDLAQPPD